MLKRVRVLISGRVQGVSFRFYTIRESERRGLSGWVRNRPDGRVEAVFEGDEAGVDEMVAWCHEGPPAARVDLAEVSSESPIGEVGFTVR